MIESNTPRTDAIVGKYGLGEGLGDITYFARQLERELAAAVAERDELRRMYKFTYCAACGEAFEIDAPECTDAIGKHIKTCAKHPMRELEQKLSKAVELINELRGYCKDSWDWKYGKRWDAEMEAIRT